MAVNEKLFPEGYSTPKATAKANLAWVAFRNGKDHMGDKLLAQAAELESKGE